MKRPNLSPAPWTRGGNPHMIYDGDGWPVTISRINRLPDARAIEALPDLLAALEAAWEAGSPFVAATARSALTKAGYTFDDPTNS